MIRLLTEPKRPGLMIGGGEAEKNIWDVNDIRKDAINVRIG